MPRFLTHLLDVVRRMVSPRRSVEWEREVAERQRAERELVQTRDALERRVAELTAANAALRAEIEARRGRSDLLRQGEERLRAVIDTALDAVVGMDAQGCVTEWNAQAEAIFGWSRAEAVGRTMDSLIIPPQHREAHTRGLERFLRTGEGPILNRRVEIEAVHRDGRSFPVELAVTPGRIGQRVFFTGFVRDIAERKQTEARLARQTWEAQALYRVTRLAAETHSFEDALQSCLDTVCEMTGWPVGHVYLPDRDRRELLPTTLWHLPQDDAHEEFRRTTEQTRFAPGQGLPGRIWTAREPIWVSNVHRDDEFPRRESCRRLTLHGSFGFPISIRGEVLAVLEFFTAEEIAPDPDLLLFVQTLGEQVGRVLERKQSEQSLRESEERFRLLADSAPVLIWMSDEDKRGVYFNQPWLDFTGQSLDDQLGDAWIEAIHPHDRAEALAACGAAFARREPFQAQFRLRRGDGEYRWVLDTGTPRFAPDGAFTGYIGSCIDIHDSKQPEQRLAFLAQASDVLASSLDYSETLTAVARLAVPHIADWCAVDVLDETGQPQRLAITHVDASKVQLAWEFYRNYPTDPDAPHGTPLVLRTGQPDWITEISDELLVQSARDDEHLRMMRALGLKSYICVPLAVRGRTLGVLTFVSSEPGRRYTEADLALAQEVARRAAMAVDNARLYRAAQQEIAERTRSEEQLRESQDRLTFTLDAVHVGTWDWDIRTNTLQWSDNLLAIHGLAPEAFDGTFHSFLQDVLPQDRDAVTVRIQQAMQDGGPYHVEYRLNRADGSLAWVEGKGRVLYDESGHPLRMTGVCTDVTERQRAEQALRESEERFRFLAESVPQKIFTATPEGEVDYFNRQWMEFTGLSFEQIRDWGWLQFIHPDDMDETIRVWQHSIDTGEPFVLEHRFRAADGRYHWHLSRALPMRDAGGAVTMWIGSNADIDVVKRAEAALRDNEERLRLVNRATNDAIWDWDLVTQRVQWNESVRTLFGYAADQVGPDSTWWYEHIHPDDRARIVHEIHAVIDGKGTSWTDEYRFRRADGSYATAIDRGHIVRGPAGEPLRMIGAMLDITERKQAEEALQRANRELQLKNREMEQFVYIVSHDLKSPLVTMTGFVGLLREDLQAGRLDDAGDCMSRIERATRRMGELIDDLLQLSRVGRVRNEPQMADVSAVLHGLQDELAPRLDEAGATLEIEPELPPVFCDRSRLTEVFDNLLGNALKYGCDGTACRIRIGSQRVEGKVRYYVRDFGRGIEPQYHEKVFDLFQRLDPSKEGTGVGLAIVRRIMEVNGGRIWVESALGEGATFWVEFPDTVPHESGSASDQ